MKGSAMRELSLHVLDLMENSISAGAGTISLTVAQDRTRDLLKIVVEDDGPGLTVPSETALDPFYTTKNSKRTGLGLSLFRSTVEQAGGQLTVRQSALGGLAVEATMQWSHVDRVPIGDIAASVCSVVCTNPELDVVCRFAAGDEQRLIRVSDVAQELPLGNRNGLAVARRVSARIQNSIETLGIGL